MGRGQLQHPASQLHDQTGIIGGAVPPIIAAPMAAAYGGIAVGALLATLAVVSWVCTAALIETKDEALDA